MNTIQEFDTSVNLLDAIIWQYDGVETIEQLLTLKNEWTNNNNNEFWQNWIRDVFDIRTANEFGLHVWSIILAVPLFVSAFPDVALTIEQKRLVLRLRFYQLITRATIPDVNEEMADVFGAMGKVYALDPNDMSSIMYVFRFRPDSDLVFILKNYDLLPRPATVGIRYRVLTYIPFGFGRFNNNFTAPFWDGGEL